MDFQISRDYIAKMYNILYCTEHSPTATSIQIMEKRQDVPYISVPTIKARLNYKE